MNGKQLCVLFVVLIPHYVLLSINFGLSILYEHIYILLDAKHAVPLTKSDMSDMTH